MGIYELFFVILHVLGMRIYNTVIFYLYSTIICTVLLSVQYYRVL